MQSKECSTKNNDRVLRQKTKLKPLKTKSMKTLFSQPLNSIHTLGSASTPYFLGLREFSQVPSLFPTYKFLTLNSQKNWQSITADKVILALENNLPVVFEYLGKATIQGKRQDVPFQTMVSLSDITQANVKGLVCFVDETTKQINFLSKVGSFTNSQSNVWAIDQLAQNLRTFTVLEKNTLFNAIQQSSTNFLLGATIKDAETLITVVKQKITQLKESGKPKQKILEIPTLTTTLNDSVDVKKVSKEFFKALFE